MLLLIRVHCSFLEFTHALQEEKEGKPTKTFVVSCFSRVSQLSAMEIETEMKKIVPRCKWVFADQGEN